MRRVKEWFIRSFAFYIIGPTTLSNWDHAPRVLRFIETRSAHMEWRKDVVMYSLVEWLARDLLNHIAEDPDGCVGVDRCRKRSVDWMTLGEAGEEFYG